MSNRTFYASTYVVADGATRTWPFSFAGVNTGQESGVTPYLYPEDVKVQELYTDADGNRQTVQRTGVLSAPNQITIDGPAIIAGREIRIYRETELRFPLVDYRDLQSVSEHDLDLANRQAVFIAQETRDTASANLVYDKQGHYNAGGRRIVDLAPGIDGRDAVNMDQYTRAIRTPMTDAALSVLPRAALRAGRVLSFDSTGQPVVNFPSEHTALALAMDLRNDTDPELGSSLITYLAQTMANPVPRSLRDKLNDIVSAKDYGAKGDGITDDSAAVQALIDALSAQGGGTIFFPRGIYRLNIVLKKYVTLIGAGLGACRGLGVSGSNINRYVVTFLAAGTGWVVDSVEAGAPNGSIGILGIDFIGLGANVPGGGVRIRKGNGNSNFRSMMFSGFADEAMHSEALVGHYLDLMSTNCLMRRVRTKRTGAFRIEGADNYIQNVEGNIGISGIVSEDLFLCGVYIGGANNYAINLMGELSEIGVFTVAEGAHHKLVNCRADLNFGHGYVGGGAMMSNCHAHNNSNKQPGKYSGFVSADGNQYSGCRATGAHKFGMDASASDYSIPAQRPNIDNFVSQGHITAEINYPAANGVVIGLRAAHLRNFSAGGTIDVSGGVNSVQFNHSEDTEITGMSNAFTGQMVALTTQVGKTILTRSSGFTVHGIDGQGKKRMQAGRVYVFHRMATGWIELTDNYVVPLVTTANRPNTFALPGMMIFDSTLNKPLWRNAANTGWVDATGSPP